MNRCHINGNQFYDWMYDHHKPLAGTLKPPAKEWPDLFKRPYLFFLLYAVISVLLIARSMKAMFYNLALGHSKNAEADGVSKSGFSIKITSTKKKMRTC